VDKTKQNHQIYDDLVKLFKQGEFNLLHKKIKTAPLHPIEKKLLNIRLLFRKKEWQEAIDQLNKLQTSIAPFYATEKFALLSYSYFMQGNFQQAYIWNMQNFILLQDLALQEKLFSCLYNQSVYTARMGQLEISNYYLTEGQKYTQTPKDKLLIIRALATNQSKQLAYKEALQTISQGEQLLNKIDNQLSLIEFQIIKVDILCRNKKYTDALNILERLPDHSKAHLRMRIIFEKILLQIIISNEITSIKWPSFLKQDSEYHLKINIIDQLTTGQLDLAKKSWRKLAKQFPRLYLPDFKMKYQSDEDSLFFKLIKLINTKAPLQNEIILKGKQKELYDILKQQQFPISKELLIEKIWHLEEYDPKFDMRLYKLIQRVKKVVNIQNINGGYFIK
jgi:hypothetical protein